MIGLVTVLYKSDEMLEDFFHSISIQTFIGYHVFLIDNSVNDSTDILIETLALKYSLNNFTHIKNHENVGVAKGNNQGIIASINSGYSHTLLLNNDIKFVQSDILEKLYSISITRNEVLVIPKILYFNSDRIWMAGGKFRILRGYTIHVGEGKRDSNCFNRSRYFDYAPTCFMLINNNIFNKLGLMDENYFVYYDDTDFLYRAYKAKIRIYYAPELTIYHKVSSSTGGSKSKFTLYYANRNRLYFIRKNYGFLQKSISIMYYFLTLLLKMIIYSKEQRIVLLQATFDAFKISYKD